MKEPGMEGYPEELQLSAADWPAQCASPRPGDLKNLISQGFGLGPPLIVTPYGGSVSGDFYGSDTPNADPFLNAPLTESSGGTLYFDRTVSDQNLTAALQVMGIYSTGEYVAYAAGSSNPVKERYLDQLRIVSIDALSSLFQARSFQSPKQSLKIPDAVIAFVTAQKKKWADDHYTFSSKLRGAAGGDGDWAKESLAFGIHVENTYWGVYRLWSRPWLVTK
jgi:hypothetical protein